MDSDGVIRSVEHLKRLSNVQWVVLSLGGNDARLKALAMSRGVCTDALNSA